MWASLAGVMMVWDVAAAPPGAGREGCRTSSCAITQTLQRGVFAVFVSCPRRILALWFGGGLALRIQLLK